MKFLKRQAKDMGKLKKEIASELGIPEDTVTQVANSLIKHPLFIKHVTETLPQDPTFYNHFKENLVEEMAKDKELRERIVSVFSDFVGRRSFLAMVGGLATSYVVGTQLAGADTIIPSYKDGTYNVLHFNPFDIIVGKEGKKVKAYNTLGKRIANGLAGTSLDNPGDDAKVIQYVVDWCINDAKKGKILGNPVDTARSFLIRLDGFFYINKTIEILNSIPNEEVGTGFNVDIPITIEGKGKWTTQIMYSCNPCIKHDLPYDGAWASTLNIKGISFADPTYNNDAIYLSRWKGYVDRVRVVASKRALVISQAWGKGCGVLHSAFNGQPKLSTEGVVHIVKPETTFTNNIIFFDLGISTQNNNTPGYALRWDDNDGGFNCRFIAVYTGDSFGQGVYIDSKGEISFTNCRLIKLDDDQGGANHYLRCDLPDSSISGAYPWEQSKITSCNLGNSHVSFSNISDSQFVGSNIIGFSSVNNCRFFAPYSVPYLVRFYGGLFVRGFVSNCRFNGRTHVIEIGNDNNFYVGQWYFENISINGPNSKVGIYRNTGGTSAEPVVFNNVTIDINSSQNYAASDVYAIYTNGYRMIFDKLFIFHSDYIGNITDDLSKTIIKYLEYGLDDNNPHCFSKNENVATITGDGTTTSFTVNVAHQLFTDNEDTIVISITPSQGTLGGYSLVDLDGDGFKETLQFTVNFATAPASGAVIPVSWSARVA